MLEKKLRFRKKITGTVATGEISYGKISELVEKIGKFAQDRGKIFKVRVCAVKNKFFGPGVTVSGLITGQDLVSQIGELDDTGGRVLITVNMLRSGEDVFLDDMTVKEAENKLRADIVAVGKTGADFVKAVLLG